MTAPGVPVSSAFPPLEHAAKDAISAARTRIDTLTRGTWPFPAPEPSTEDKEAALKDAAQQVCYLCGAYHAAPNSPACPRIATFKVNGDGTLVEGTFWPDVSGTEQTTLDRDGNVLSVTATRISGWATGRATFVADLAEEETGDDGAHPA